MILVLFTFLALVALNAELRRRQVLTAAIVQAARVMRDAPFYNMTGGQRYRALGRAVDLHRGGR